MKKIALHLFLLLLVLSMLGAASASTVASGSCGDSVFWELDSSGVLTISGTGKMSDYSSYGTNVVPWKDNKASIKSVVIENGVTAVGEYAFDDCPNLTAVTMADSVEYLYDYAFRNCAALKSVSFSDSLRWICEACFMDCTALADVVLPEELSDIGDDAFANCKSLSEIVLPDSVNEISSGVFEGSGIRKVSISARLKSVGYKAFADCTKLTEITFRGNSAEGLQGFGFDDNIFKNVTATAYYPLSNNTWVPDCFQDYGGSIKWVGYGAFDFGKLAPSGTCGKGLKWKITADGELVISGVGDMEDYTVLDDPYNYPPWYEYSAGIKRITVENGVTSIGDGAFFFMINMTEIDLPTSIIRFGEDVFYYCTSLKRFYVPAGVGVVPKGLLANCTKLESVTIAQGITAIGTGAFAGCESLKTIDIPSSVTSIGALAFEFCESFTEITIPDSVTSIDDGCFSWCSNLKTVKLSNRLGAIPRQAFFVCPSLEKLIIPVSVTQIGEEAFGYYTPWDDGPTLTVEFDGNPPEFHENAFSYSLVALRYPVTDTAWSALASKKSDFGASKITYSSYFPQSSILDCELTLTPASFFYDGTAKKPAVKLTLHGRTLVQGTDYTVEFSNNVNAGSASVRIIGKDSFSDTMRSNFTIAPADPILTFAEKSVTKVEGAQAFTNQLTKTTDGTITYSSANPGVATVDQSTGKVSVVGSGTTIIKATASAGKNYKLGYASYTLIVEKKQAIRDFTVSDLSFSFSNSRSGLGLSSNYYTPLSAFERFLPVAKAREYWTKYGRWGGYCYGFAAASGMFSVDGSALDLSWFGKTRIRDLKPTTYSSKLGMDVGEVLEVAWVSQLASGAGWAEEYTRNDLDGLVELLKKTPYTGEPVLIGINSSRGDGHAILGYKYEKINNSRARIYICDNNYPLKERYITLGIDASGRHTSWLYDKGSSSKNYGTNYGGHIDYTPFSVYNALWDSRGLGTSNDISVVWIDPWGERSTYSFELRDYAGNLLAKVDKGKFISYSPSVYEQNLLSAGIYTEDTVLCMPADTYTIVNTDGGSLDITMAHNLQSASVVTDASSVTISVVDDEAINMVSVDADADESYQVTLSSALDCAEGMEELKFSGFGSSAPVRLGMSGSDLYMANCTGVTLWINDVMYASAAEEFQRNIEKHTIELEYSACGYDGSAKEPGVTVYNGGYNLERGKDFVVVYSDNVQIGTASATVYGIGSYTGTVTLTFRIMAANGTACAQGHFWNAGELIGDENDPENGVMHCTCMVCGATEDRPFRGYDFELGEVFDEYVEVKLINNLPYTISGECCLVAYDANGSIIGFTTELVELHRDNYRLMTLDFKTGKRAASVKAFVIEPTSFAPLCPAWTSVLK